MSVFDEELHMFGDMDVDDDGCVVLDIELQVVEVLNRVSKFLYPLLKGPFYRVMFFLRSLSHVPHGLDLQGCHPCLLIKY